MFGLPLAVLFLTLATPFPRMVPTFIMPLARFFLVVRFVEVFPSSGALSVVLLLLLDRARLCLSRQEHMVHAGIFGTSCLFGPGCSRSKSEENERDTLREMAHNQIKSEESTLY